MNQEVEFTPKMIGLQDTEKKEKIQSLYEELVNLLTCCKWDYESLNQVIELPLNEFLEMLKMKPAELSTSLKKQIVKAENISSHGYNMDTMLDHIALPENYHLVISHKAGIDNLVREISKTRFNFPVSNLYDEETREFSLNEKFESELHKFTAKYTETVEQNRVVDIIQRFSDVLNDLIELKLIRPEAAMWTHVGERLSLAIKNNRGDRPLSPDDKMFMRGPLKRFAKPIDYMSQDQNDIIS